MRYIRFQAIVLVLVVVDCLSTSCQGSFAEFSYQGQLETAIGKAEGKYDFKFKVYDASDGGRQFGETVYCDNISVTNGVFTVEIDPNHPAAFRNMPRFLDIAVRPSGSSSEQEYIALPSRQKINSVPYAVHAGNGVPIGTIMPFHTFDGALPIPDGSDGWQVCDGSVITEKTSPLFGKKTPDLRNKFLRGDASGAESGNTGGCDSGSTGYRDGGTDLNSHKHQTTEMVGEDYVLYHPTRYNNIAPFGKGNYIQINVIYPWNEAGGATGWWLLTDVPYNTDLNAHTHSVTTIPEYYSVIYIIRIE